jgi:hypothetical protein
MSRSYNSYGNYYDPLGSQSNQPTGYTYQNPTQSSSYQTAPSSAYGSSNYQSYGNSSYGTQQYSANAQQANTSSTNHAAAALSSLSSQNYTQTSSANTTSSNARYDGSNWSGNTGSSSNVYGNNPLAMPNRTQSNNSPLYSTQSSNTFGRLSVPEQTQSPTETFGASQRTYQNAPSNAGVRGSSYYSQQQNPPPRYNSPLHAVQASQHGHRQQASQSSNKLQSPQIANAQQNRQQSASVEPSPTTVDPSQVYDNRAELQRKAQLDEQRRKIYEAEQAARKAEEDRVAEEKRKQDAADKAEAEAAKKAEDNKRKNEQRKKAREEKKQSKNAATALQRLASGESSGPAANDEEAEMREMFKKMREFNAKNPAMLAKLWDEERKSHEAAKSTPTPAAASPTHTRTASAGSPTAASASSNVRSFTKPTAPAKASKAASASKSTPQPTPTQPAKPSPSPANNNSLWPPHKKGALAEVTAKWLLSLPQNVGKTITPANVHSILDTNPSYVQLCESLESYGLQFDRSTLARELLKAVPDGMKPQPAKPATPLNGAAQTNGASAISSAASRKDRKADSTPRTPAVTNYEAPMSLSDVAREVNTMGQQPYPAGNAFSPVQDEQSRYFASSMSNGSRPVSQSQPPEVKPEVKPEEPPRPPADKEEAARKRTFGDLVDLTAEDSDEESGPPTKKTLLSSTSSTNGANVPFRDPIPYLSKPVTFQQYAFQNNQMPGMGGFYLPGQQRPSAPPVQRPVQSGTPQPNGQQPTLPSQAPAPVRPKGPAPEQLQAMRMKGKMLVEPIMRDRVARKSKYDSRTIARDVLLATGRHPDMRGLNAHLASMQKLLSSHGGDFEGGNRSDLYTIRWDLIDPEPAKKEEQEEEPGDQLQQDLVQDLRQSNGPISTSTSQLLQTSTPKKRGRPKKTDYFQPAGRSASGSPAPQLTNTAVNATSDAPHSSTNTPSHPPAPASNMASGSAKPLGYSSFQQIGPDGKKKKGRPFGWKKELHSREAQGLAPATNPARKVGRPPKAAGSPASKLEAGGEVKYPVFKCQWMGCKSEAHNAEVLKKHLVKVHAQTREDGKYVCHWVGCGEEKEGIEDWIAHVDEKHVLRLRWRLGDGVGVGGE